jgi:pimeloyl-ACP methyl ester carboxylesterase
MDGAFVNKLILPGKGRKYSGTRSRGLVWLKNSKDHAFPNHFLKRNTKTVILYSHGNGGTLGDFKAIVNFYSEWFSTSVFAIEYPGYGPAEGESSEESVNDNLETAYRFLSETLNYPAENIILIGYSIGTGPTINLAVDLCERGTPPGAVVTIAAFKSLRAIVGDWKGTMFANLLAGFLTNRWNSIERVKELTCPSFFVHGALDEVIPSTHSEELYKACASDQKRKKICPKADHARFDEPFDTTDSISEFLEEVMRPNMEVTVKAIPTDFMEVPPTVKATELLSNVQKTSLNDKMNFIGDNGCVNNMGCVGNTFYNILFFWLPSSGGQDAVEDRKEGEEDEHHHHKKKKARTANSSEIGSQISSAVGGASSASSSMIDDDRRSNASNSFSPGKKKKREKTQMHVDLPDDAMVTMPESPGVMEVPEDGVGRGKKKPSEDPAIKEAVTLLDAYFAALSAHDVDSTVKCLDNEVLVRYPEEPDKANKSWSGHSKARSRYTKMFQRSPNFEGSFKALATESEGSYATILASAKFECSVSGLNVIRDILYVISADTKKIIIIDHK